MIIMHVILLDFIMHVILLGFHPRLVALFHEKARRLTWARRTAARPAPMVTKTFTPKCPELPKLSTYEGSFPTDFWKFFPCNRPLSWDPSSWISGERLLDEAVEAGVDNLTDARRAKVILTEGADTG